MKHSTLGRTCLAVQHAAACVVVIVGFTRVPPVTAQPADPPLDAAPQNADGPAMEPLWEIYHSGRFVEAAAHGQQLLKQYPDHRELHHLVGRSIVEAGHNLRTHEAVEHLKRSMNGLPPENWMVGWSHFYIGYAYEISYRQAEAIDSYKLAIAAGSTPECTKSATTKMRHLVHVGLAPVLKKMQQRYAARDYRAVIHQGQKLLKRMGSGAIDDPLFFHLLGRAGMDQGQQHQLKQSVAHLERSLELKDARTWIEAWNHYYLGWACEQSNKLDNARTHLHKAIELNATVECSNSARVRLRHLGRDPYQGWQSYETDYLVLRYPPDSAIADRPDKYMRELQKAHRAIRSFLHVFPQGKITIYLYNSAQQGWDITGQKLGWSDRHDQIAHQHNEQPLGHEMTHCLSHFITRLAYCDSVVVNEGLAVYLDQTDKDKHLKAREAARDGKLPTFSQLEQSFRVRDDAYPLAGSFVGFLLEEYSLDLFFGFWRDSADGKYEQGFRRNYHRSSDQLSRDWVEYLKEKK